MSNSETARSGGIGFCGLLAIVFITLKLTHYIDWAWYWVLAPLWAPITIVLAVMLIFIAGSVIIGALGIFIAALLGRSGR